MGLVGLESSVTGTCAGTSLYRSCPGFPFAACENKQAFKFRTDIASTGVGDSTVYLSKPSRQLGRYFVGRYIKCGYPVGTKVGPSRAHPAAIAVRGQRRASPQHQRSP